MNPLADAFPLAEGPEFESLVASIRDVGQQQPALTWVAPDGTAFLIDGRNRVRACATLGIEPRIEVWNGTQDKLPGLLVALNLARRHLSPSPRALVSECIATLTHGGARQEVLIPNELTLAQAASAVDVGVSTIQYVRVVRRAGRDDLP